MRVWSVTSAMHCIALPECRGSVTNNTTRASRCTGRVLRHASEVDMSDHSDYVENALASLAWRSLAALQLYLEAKYNITPPVNARSDD